MPAKSIPPVDTVRLGANLPTLNHGAKIRAARELSGIDRKGLAKTLGISYQRIADIELDRKPISLELIIRIAEGIGCDPNSIDDRLASMKSKR